MSSGPVGGGVIYYATIKIAGPLTESQLQTVVNAIKATLAATTPVPVNGALTAQVRLENLAPPITTIRLEEPGT
jgi:hypothetical protein